MTTCQLTIYSMSLCSKVLDVTVNVVISTFCGFLSTLNLSGITSKFDIINMFIIFDSQYLI